jgi:hypothetical protein
MIYFAMNGFWDSEVRGAWTAVSRAPWLKAIALYAKGDCWHGGGLFLDNQCYWLNNGYGHDVLAETSEVNRDDEFEPDEDFGGECPGVYYVRLQRDGWVLKGGGAKAGSGKAAIFEKCLPMGWALRKIVHAEVGPPKGKGCYWDEHELVSEEGVVQQFPDWEWAECDGRRLVWATNGCLYASPIITEKELGPGKLLHDFSSMKFRRVAAPY